MDANYLEIVETNPAPSEPCSPKTDPVTLTADTATMFGIRIGCVGLLVSSSIYCEVLDKTLVNPLPNVVPWLSGLLNLRGNLVPVFDLHSVLSEAAVDRNKRKLFVIGGGDKAAALWIDGLPEIKESGQFEPVRKFAALPKIQQRFVSASYEQDGQVWFHINFEDLFEALGHHHYVTEDSLA
jgi:twitching motility protein PilI